MIEGAATVNESAITGESAPVVRESGGDRSSVTGGTRVLSDWLVVRISVNPGETFLDRMISLVEGAKRQRTPNEIALSILLAKFTLIFLLACVTLLPFSIYSVKAAGQGDPVSITVLVALLVCLIPTTIGGLLSAIGIAGMDRMIQANVIATSGPRGGSRGRRRRAAARQDRHHHARQPPGVGACCRRRAWTETALADAAQLASLADETPEGRSIVVLAKQKYNLRERDLKALGAKLVPFSAHTRMSGVDLEGRQVRKGAADAVRSWVETQGGRMPQETCRSGRHRLAARLDAAGRRRRRARCSA